MDYLARGLPQLNRPAVADSGGVWNYAELLRRTETVAARLKGREGWTPGDRVGLFLQRRKESVALFLGVLGAGGVAVPFSVRGTGREIAHQISDAGITTIITDSASRGIAAESVALAEMTVARPRLLEMRTLLDDPLLPGPLDVDATQPALILYTSGTTGRPKGVVHTHGSLMAQVDLLRNAWEWNAEDRLLHVLPLHHIHGLVNGVLGALWAGAALQFHDAFVPASVWDAFAERHASVFYAVPTIYHQLAEAWHQQEAPTQRRWVTGGERLRLMVSGSAALPVSLWKRWREITNHALLERYGMTEIGMALSNPYSGERRPGTVGQALPGIQVRIISEAGDAVPAGDSGEIVVQGPTLFREYWNQPDATRAAFRDGWFRTGDIAEEQNGYICIRGRASVDILKSAGYKISALEIEEVLREHPAIREVAVVGVPDSEWGERITACVVAQPGCTPAADEICGWCKDKLAPYKWPRRLEIFSELPRNAMGKVTKPELIQQLATRGRSSHRD